jgi:hypothetical protein
MRQSIEKVASNIVPVNNILPHTGNPIKTENKKAKLLFRTESVRNPRKM